MIFGENTLTASGCTHKAKLNVICDWIKQAWDDIPTMMTQKSFRKCYITNAFDGEESKDPFEDVDDAEPIHDELYYADTTMFGSSDDEEDFYGI